MKTLILNIKNHLIGFLIGVVAVTTITVFADSAGSIGSLFQETVSGNGIYKLIGTNIIDGSITNTQLASGIDGAKISNIPSTSISGVDASLVGNKDVNNAKFSYLNSVTSNVQNQLNNKLSYSFVVANAGYIPKYTGVGFSNSIISDNGTTVAVAGNLSATNVNTTCIGNCN